MSMLKIGMDINCGLDYEEGTWTQPEFPWTPEEVEEIFQVHGLRPDLSRQRQCRTIRCAGQ